MPDRAKPVSVPNIQVLRDNGSAFLQFVSELKKVPLVDSSKVEVHMLYLMPGYPQLDAGLWEKVAGAHGIDGIVFYKTGFPVDRLIKSKVQ